MRAYANVWQNAHRVSARDYDNETLHFAHRLALGSGGRRRFSRDVTDVFRCHPENNETIRPVANVLRPFRDLCRCYFRARNSIRNCSVPESCGPTVARQPIVGQTWNFNFDLRKIAFVLFFYSPLEILIATVPIDTNIIYTLSSVYIIRTRRVLTYLRFGSISGSIFNLNSSVRVRFELRD